MSDEGKVRAWTVIMAGGVGSRFWPLSRAARPKQLLDLFGRGSMLRRTFDRLTPLVPAERQLVVTGRVLGEAIRAELPELRADQVLEEPLGRNTAAAIGWAALEIVRRDPHAVLAVLPADQFIVDGERYRSLVEQALAGAAADGGRIVTLGIPPTRPETGYGYIRAGASIDGDLRVVEAFKEKPDLETALGYLEAGGYYWNAGMFFMPAQLFLDELQRFEPELRAGLDELYGAEGGSPGPARLDAVYPGLKSISVDYAVMERTARVAVIPGEFGWSDVGSWRSLYDFRGAARASFVVGDVIEIDGGGNVILADGGATVAAVDVRDLVIVHTADATLVCPRESAQRVREVVDALRAGARRELL